MKRTVLSLPILLGCGPVLAGEFPSALPPSQDVQPAETLRDLELEGGTRLRVVRKDGRILDAQYQSSDAGTLALQTDDGTVRLPEESVYQIYRIEKRRGKGALKGLFVGLGITAALGVATLTQATESGEGGLGFGIGLAFAVPISVAIGVVGSPDRRELVYQNPGFAPPEARGPPPQEPEGRELPRAPRLPPEIPRSFYLGVSGGASYLGGEPISGAATVRPSPSVTFAVEGLYRASEHWGFGGEVLFTDAGAWTWTVDGRAGTDSRKIVAPGFKIFYFPVVGANELVINGGVSAFRQEATQIRADVNRAQPFTETKLDAFFNVGLSYHRYVHPKLGLGVDVQYYNSGMQIPSPLVLVSASISFRATPPPMR